MSKKNLKDVTLVIVDCVDFENLDNDAENTEDLFR